MGEWLLALLSPDRIQQFGIAATTVLTGWTARQASVVKKLQAEVAELKAGRAADQEKFDAEVAELKDGRVEDQARFRVAIRFIRELLRYTEHLDAYVTRHAPGQQPPATRPSIPDSLAEEI